MEHRTEEEKKYPECDLAEEHTKVCGCIVLVKLFNEQKARIEELERVLKDNIKVFGCQNSCEVEKDQWISCGNCSICDSEKALEGITGENRIEELEKENNEIRKYHLQSQLYLQAARNKLIKMAYEKDAYTPTWVDQEISAEVERLKGLEK